jgi:uncharacterized protein involved in type VI secretion and phage assembly
MRKMGHTQDSAMKFYGKYRGLVVDNADPLGLARLKVQVPAMPGASLESWALPCVPYAGTGGDARVVGLHLIPPLGANVWVEFEGGNLNHPIWAGCFWGDGQPLAPNTLSPDGPSSAKVLQTQASTFILEDRESDPFIKLEIDSPACEQAVSIILDNDGVSLTCGNGSVSIHPSEGITLRISNTKITMTEKNIELDAETIRINAQKELVLAAQGEIEMCPHVQSP